MTYLSLWNNQNFRDLSVLFKIFFNYNTQLSVGDGTITGAINEINTGLNAMCKYAQSNSNPITNGYIDISKKEINTAENVFEYSSSGILIKEPGMYIIVSHFHVLAAADDLINVFMELNGHNYDNKSHKSICVPVTIQATDQIVHIAKIDTTVRALIHFESQSGKSNVFTEEQTNSNYIIIKKIY